MPPPVTPNIKRRKKRCLHAFAWRCDVLARNNDICPNSFTFSETLYPPPECKTYFSTIIMNLEENLMSPSIRLKGLKIGFGYYIASQCPTYQLIVSTTAMLGGHDCKAKV